MKESRQSQSQQQIRDSKKHQSAAGKGEESERQKEVQREVNR